MRASGADLGGGLPASSQQLQLSARHMADTQDPRASMEIATTDVSPLILSLIHI